MSLFSLAPITGLAEENPLITGEVIEKARPSCVVCQVPEGLAIPIWAHLLTVFGVVMKVTSLIGLSSPDYYIAEPSASHHTVWKVYRTGRSQSWVVPYSD